jgi:drug/metabolite transporter (DMT)-like permease
LLLLALLLFVALDTTVKSVSKEYAVLVTVWFRYLFQAIIMAIWLLPTRGLSGLKTSRPFQQALRGALLLVSGSLASLSLVHMPLGEFTAIAMLTPLIVVLLSIVVLKERVGFLRWILLVAGFFGAVLVLRPNAMNLGWYMALPIGMVLVFSVFHLHTSHMARTEDPLLMHFYTGCFGALVMTAILPWIWTQAPDPHIWLMLLLIGVFATVGHLLMLIAFASAPASTLSPFMYAQVAFAVVAGCLVFDHFPGAVEWGGISLIVVSGVLSAWIMARRQTLLNRR